MKYFLYILLILFSATEYSFAQPETQAWQGAIIKAGQKIDNGNPFYLNLSIDNGEITGESREEIFNTELFAVKQLKGRIDNGIYEFQQIVIQKSSKSSRTKWCRYSCNLSYDSITGYLSGTYKSTDCRRIQGQIILYKSDVKIEATPEPSIHHHWFELFINEIHEGLNAPEIRKKERDNFVFTPVYFDYDKSDIRSEHYVFLNRLIKVVKGHSDLRVKVTGHTDSDGSNQYNDELSKRRAQSIIDYFVRHGLKPDRLVFDFKGETAPVDTNKTKEGKQRNRRVDFSFI